jgi:hypothetical protein
VPTRIYGCFVTFLARGNMYINVATKELSAYSGELTRNWGLMLFSSACRDLFILVTEHVDPSSPGLNDYGSWGLRNSSDGSISVITLYDYQ